MYRDGLSRLPGISTKLYIKNSDVHMLCVRAAKESATKINMNDLD